LEGTAVERRMTIKLILKKEDIKLLTGLVLDRSTNGGLI
jgi:hypothetical protein